MVAQLTQLAAPLVYCLLGTGTSVRRRRILFSTAGFSDQYPESKFLPIPRLTLMIHRLLLIPMSGQPPRYTIFNFTHLLRLISGAFLISVSAERRIIIRWRIGGLLIPKSRSWLASEAAILATNGKKRSFWTYSCEKEREREKDGILFLSLVAML